MRTKLRLPLIARKGFLFRPAGVGGGSGLARNPAAVSWAKHEGRDARGYTRKTRRARADQRSMWLANLRIASGS
jgi:hypothetical protein